MKGGKLVAFGLSLIVVVGVVIAVIVGTNRANNDSSSHDDKDDKVLATTSKSIASVCSQTDYKKACVNSLSSMANNQSATPKDFIEKAIEVAIQEVRAGMERSASIGKAEAHDSLQKMATEDCKDLLHFAIDELQASFSSVGDNELHNIADREIELKNWLSAVISYQQTCMDGFTQPELKNAISTSLLNATQLTDNVLAIVATISEILSAFNIPIGNSSNTSSATTATSRRLLEANNDDEEAVHNTENGFPAWLPSGDRKLLAARNNNPQSPPNAVVAKDGSGQYNTIAAALAAYPKNLKGRYVIYVKAGIYDEYITITKDQVNIFMYGDGPRKTIVTGKKCNRDGVTTYQSASFSAVGNGFIAKSMGFQNIAGPEGHQAVALRVQSDMSAFYNCRMDGYQDTLYAQTHRQFYRNCVVSGTVDFIFGDAAAILQNCLIIARKPMDNQQNTVTAQGRTNIRETTGLIIQNCRIVPEQLLEPVRFKIPSYLGRPWKMYSRTVIMESTLADFIQPAGWMHWSGNFALDTCYYAEYGNRGPGANTNNRVKWKGFKVITDRNEALQFTTAPFIQGNQWLGSTGSPYYLGLKN
ncbi:probable pectinesterase/pectinesterase inhibitor 13 [Nicotiana sylvestris]|uniref:Pectinesterase n=1 Tax=Nicotiana sylvestris TaxID=4096 RepID=A0A1U7YLC4_NICSY|nr:PREDICTED: pectinesterase-like [Nicotiana sylvestris]